MPIAVSSTKADAQYQAADRADRLPCSDLLAKLDLPDTKSDPQPTHDGTCRVQIHRHAYDLELFASRDLNRKREKVLFALLEDNMKPLYTASPQGWTPRIKRGEMRMDKSRFLVLYDTGQDPAQVHGTSEFKSGTHDGKVDTTPSEPSVQAADQLPSKRKRATLSSALTPLAKRTRLINKPRPTTNVAGYIMFQFDTDPLGLDDRQRKGYPEVSCAYLYEVQVGSAYRGRGLGTWMLDRISHLASRAGVDQARLTCFQSNVGAQRLYRRAGFQVDDLTPVDDPECDYVIMSKEVLLLKKQNP